MQTNMTLEDLKALNNPVNKSAQARYNEKINSNPTLKKEKLRREALWRRKTGRVKSNELDYKTLQDNWLQSNKPKQIKGLT